MNSKFFGCLGHKAVCQPAMAIQVNKRRDLQTTKSYRNLTHLFRGTIPRGCALLLPLLEGSEIKYCDSSHVSNPRACRSAHLRETTTPDLRTTSPRIIRAPSTGAMWLRRAASTHSRVGMAYLSRFLQHERCVAHSMSRCAVSPRYASSTSFQPQLDPNLGKSAVDLEPARRVLRETFGHQAFRPGQEEVVRRLLAGESLTISWPARSGASICYLVRKESSSVITSSCNLSVC